MPSLVNLTQLQGGSNVLVMAQPTVPQHVLFHVNNEVGRAFSWISVGLAVLTAVFQGLVTALALMTEGSSHWTFRFRLALIEHWWWTFASFLLLASLVMNALSFASGNGGDAISVLALSSATFLAIVQYMLPAWQGRHYIHTRWLAWTGNSRTTIRREKAKFCGNQAAWKMLVERNTQKLSRLQPTPSDYYGWKMWPSSGITHDPADILVLLSSKQEGVVDMEKGETPVGVYHNSAANSEQVSLVWGQGQGFRIRISRAISSMPLGLLKSAPTTSDGYDGKGLTKAMGILGRNKGLQPWNLVFRAGKVVTSHMENISTWTPRPAKVLRSFYEKTLNEQYNGLGKPYVHAAVELALLMADMPYWAIDKWLQAGLEHQDLATNQFLATEVLNSVTAEEKEAVLSANYESSYVSMIISLNAMDMRMKNKHERHISLARPDLLCLGILLKAREQKEPSWWNREDVRQRRAHEVSCLSQDLDWMFAMARLLGLETWPTGFEHNPSAWDSQDKRLDLEKESSFYYPDPASTMEPKPSTETAETRQRQSELPTKAESSSASPSKQAASQLGVTRPQSLAGSGSSKIESNASTMFANASLSEEGEAPGVVQPPSSTTPQDNIEMVTLSQKKSDPGFLM